MLIHRSKSSFSLSPVVLGLTKKPAAFVGYDLGGSVAAGFAAKYPNLCASLALLNVLGVKYKPSVNEKLLNRKYIGTFFAY